MRIVLDATPLFGTRTGVGRYVQQLITRLPAAVAEVAPGATISAATWTARGGKLTKLPPGIEQFDVRIPSRVLFSIWERYNRPTIETFLRHHHGQGLSARQLSVDEIFHPATYESYVI